MSLKKELAEQWTCNRCDYTTYINPYATRCGACGHDEVLSDRDIQNNKNRAAFAKWWGRQRDKEIIDWLVSKTK